MLSNPTRHRIREILDWCRRNPLLACTALDDLRVAVFDTSTEHVAARKEQFMAAVLDAAIVAIAEYLVQDCGISVFEVYPEQDDRPATSHQQREIFRLFDRTAPLSRMQAATVLDMVGEPYMLSAEQMGDLVLAKRRRPETTPLDLGFDWFVEQVGGPNGGLQPRRVGRPADAGSGTAAHPVGCGIV